MNIYFRFINTCAEDKERYACKLTGCLWLFGCHMASVLHFNVLVSWNLNDLKKIAYEFI